MLLYLSYQLIAWRNVANSRKRIFKGFVWWGTLPRSEASFSKFKATFITVDIKKDDVFIKLDEKNNSEYFIVSGFARSFLLNPDGEEITLSFYKRNSTFSTNYENKDQQIIVEFSSTNGSGIDWIWCWPVSESDDWRYRNPQFGGMRFCWMNWF